MENCTSSSTPFQLIISLHPVTLAMKLVSLFTFLAAALTVQAGQAEFFIDNSCSGVATHTFRTTGCNVCFSPPGDYGAIRYSNIATTRKVASFNQPNCNSESVVSQGYGPACWVQGATRLRSAFISCEVVGTGGNQTKELVEMGSNTTLADAATILEE
jgi:hypothetical protein